MQFFQIILIEYNKNMETKIKADIQKENNNPFTGWIKFIIGWMVVFGIRLIPFRVPNVEPVLATQMPFAKKFGWMGGFLFGFLSIVIFDVFTSGIGMWTWITAFAYGFLGIAGAAFFRNRESTRKNYVTFGVLGTLFYDAVTGLSVGPLFFGQSFLEAFIGQIPFTAYHLAGTIAFSLVISPILYKWVIENEVLETKNIFQKLGLVRR